MSSSQNVAKKASSPKKNPICADFPPEEMQLYRQARRLERNGQKSKITEEMKIARKKINKMYLDLNAAAKASRPVHNVPTQVVCVATASDAEKYKAWLKQKRVEKFYTLGTHIMTLHKEANQLTKLGQTDRITSGMQEASRAVRRLEYKQNRRSDSKKKPAPPAVVAPAVVAPAVVAPAESVDEEVFNFNWRPASRRSNLTVNITVSF
jgi:hypothetical protein